MKDFKLIDLLFFNRLIMPSILTILYWLSLACVVLSCLFNIFQGNFFYGLFCLISGAIVTRIGFELICVTFSINRNLEKLVAMQSENTNKLTNSDN
ncbi:MULTISPECIES: DUF4282 domain-containing protein [unclassified Gilliamella]|uniref:DUF4282 domain-containing protein n=1 Tax=unclassified Gilliamella TaxID=2685620 RepID=UPI003A5D18E9|nr:DUF4282 domain-containing protein [Gilliamella sp. B3831]MCX8577245.1 DUF4282 domain-containing protein [Gilliamella sp. B3815]MCX8590170.1 DUF4282 domain-containing protein [Gilliamella sp. B3812]MCX8604599.1 DUF4282 domain-containing protein [Gilliamella sp. B3823]MCX8604944.1 DUF4282 domain-containing protein [Gilliamella sp. B3825]MCX8638263.1 DUF4282 domain-containing protein [Gilliamella sp. B3817]